MIRSFHSFPPTVALDVNLQAWVARCSVKPGMDFLLAVDAFIAAGKASDWWTQLAAIYLFCAPTLQAAQQNLKSNAFNLTVHGAVYHDPLNGVISDQTSGYLDTGATPTAIMGANIASDNMIGVYAQSITPGVSGDVGARGGGSPANQIAISLKRSVATTGIWNNQDTQIAVSSGTGYGLNCAVRTSTSGGIWCVGSTVTNWSRATVAAPVGNLLFLRAGSGSTFYGLNQLAFGFAGASLTADQAHNLSDACDNLLKVLGTYVVPPDPQPVTPPNCFINTTIDSVTPIAPPFRVFRFGAPPSSDSVVGTNDYVNFPATDLITRPWSGTATSTQTKLGVWELLWGDRGLGENPGENNAWAKKPNDTMGIIKNSQGYTCAAQFSTYTKAIGSTLVKQMWSAGYTARSDVDGAAVATLLFQYGYLPTDPGSLGWLDAADAFSYDTTGWAGYSGTDLTTDANIDTGNGGNPAVFHRKWAVANADTFFPDDAIFGSYKVSNEKVILGQGRLCDMPGPVKGFALDCEMDDDRGNFFAPDGSTDLFTATALLLAAAAHGKGLSIGAFTDSLTAGGSHLGLTPSNAATVLGTNGFDLVNIFTSFAPPGGGSDPQADWLQAQLDILSGVSLSKICLELAVGGPGQEISLPNVTSARNFMISRSLIYSYITNDYGTPGGALSRTYNQVLATFYGLPTS